MNGWCGYESGVNGWCGYLHKILSQSACLDWLLVSLNHNGDTNV